MPHKVTGESGQLQESGESDTSTANRVCDLATNQGGSRRDLSVSTSSPAAHQHLLESKVTGIFVANLDGSVTDANDSFLRMTGHEREDLPLRSDIMTAPEFRWLDEAKVEEVLNTGASMPWKTDYIRKDGSRVSVLIGASVIDKAEGQSVCFAVDLSEAHRAEEARRISEQRYMALYDNIPLMCFTVDSVGTILTINGYAAAHLGYRPDELIGQSVLSVVHPDDTGKLEQQLGAALADRGHTVRGQLRKMCKAGSVLWVQETVRAVPEDGEQLLVLCEDLTERKQIDEQLAQNQGRLKSLTIDTVLAEEDERRRIAQGLHDQVGHTLALAKMKVSALWASEHSPHGHQMIGEICGYLDEAIYATRALTFELSSPVLYEVGLEAALQTLGEQLEEQTKLRFDFDCDPAPKPIAEETAVIIYRIVEELLFNVFKHAHAHNVHMCVQRLGGGLQVSVEDDGVGLTTSQDGRLPGSRGRFGLFSIRARIEQLGGQFDIGRSDLGGARAVLIVPIESTESGVEAPHPRGDEDGRLHHNERCRR